MTTRNPYAWAVSLIATVFGAGNIALGLVLVSAPRRVLGGSFVYVTGGSVRGAVGWGAVFIASGTVALFGQWTHRRWPTRAAHFASGIGCTWWVLAFAVAARQSDAVTLTGCVAYAIIGLTHTILGIASPHRPRL